MLKKRWSWRASFVHDSYVDVVVCTSVSLWRWRSYGSILISVLTGAGKAAVFSCCCFYWHTPVDGDWDAKLPLTMNTHWQYVEKVTLEMLYTVIVDDPS